MQTYRQVVRITPGGQAIERVVAVSKSKSEDVLWVAQGNGGPWTITFDKDSNGSPFTMTQYTVPRGDSHGSLGGAIGAHVGGTYRYNIRDASGKITDDPDVDVES